MEAKFEPSLLNTAIYLLGLSQQVSTFAINYQGRPFREGIRENPALYWGLVGAATVAFSGSTDFIPELNRWLQIVEMEGHVSVIISTKHDTVFSDPLSQFKLKLTMMMVLDFVGCWLIENACKYLFASLEPMAMITKGRERRDQRRLEEAKKAS